MLRVELWMASVNISNNECRTTSRNPWPVLFLLMRIDSYTVHVFVILNRIAQRKQMDLIVRYELEGTVHSRYFGQLSSQRQRAEDLLSTFFEGAKNLDLGDLIQASIYGPNTKKMFSSNFQQHLLFLLKKQI